MKVKIKLVGLDGNAFALMGAWREAAIKQGFKEEDVEDVLDQAVIGDYDNLLRVLSANSE